MRNVPQKPRRSLASLLVKSSAGTIELVVSGDMAAPLDIASVPAPVPAPAHEAPGAPVVDWVSNGVC